MAIWMAAVMLISAGADDWRTGPPFIEIESPKAAAEISGCLGEKWQHRSGQTSYIPTASGFTMRLTYSVFGQPLVATEVQVADDGQSRKVSVRARKGDRSQKLRDEIAACA